MSPKEKYMIFACSKYLTGLCNMIAKTIFDPKDTILISTDMKYVIDGKKKYEPKYKMTQRFDAKFNFGAPRGVENVFVRLMRFKVKPHRYLDIHHYTDSDGKSYISHVLYKGQEYRYYGDAN
jgi:hypothetical protein